MSVRDAIAPKGALTPVRPRNPNKFLIGRSMTLTQQTHVGDDAAQRLRLLERAAQSSIIDSSRRPENPPDHELLGQRLINRGLITQQQLEQALEIKSRSSTFLGQVLVDLGFVSASVLGALLADTFRVVYVDLLAFEPEVEAVVLVSENLIRSTQAIPVRLRGDSLQVAMVDPL